MQERQLIVIHLDTLGVQEILDRHFGKLTAVSVSEQDLLHEEEFTIRLQLEGIFDCFIVLDTHQLHILLFGDTVRHFCCDLGVLLVHVVNVQVPIDPILKSLFLVARITIAILGC